MEQPECVREPEGDQRPDALQVRRPSFLFYPFLHVVYFFQNQLSFLLRVLFRFLPVAAERALLCCPRLRQSD